ncbi:restriction endonuclease subunit S [Aliidiomarina maris]|uniref:Restriction endonuclease subunit S n=1 Tax=Aliidiomarina maris TaxID=531312 RepID=A0A327WX65_9GAMM|nr:restriction endonuclease subunit S [Aliidiomarina maris]RAJ97090.1 type I restriction enzyme S subunit [Aliidiomarina maris]RUO24690.1 restriction endonuclease subunit S [Aliidiomarina maris]
MVPEGWEKRDLHGLIKVRHGFAFKSKFFAARGDFILLTPGSFNESGGFRDQGEKTKYYVGDVPDGYLLKKGDMLLAMTEQAKGLLGSALFVPENNKYLHNQRLGLVQITAPEQVLIEFLYLLFNAPATRKQITEQSTGTKVKHTSPERLCSVIGLIPPFPEQMKIALIISTWDKVITTTEQLLANSQQQKRALMQQLLSGKKRLLDENKVRFSGEWKWLKVSDLLKVRKEKQVPTEDIPLFSLTIEDGITPKSARYNREFLVKNTDEKKYKLVKPNDIVYNPANLRWGAINFSRIDHSVVVSPIYEVLHLKDENNSSLEFIAQKLMMPDQIGRFAAMVEGTLVERMAVKIEPFLATKLSVPQSLEEQQKIAAVLSAADQEITALKQKLDALKQEKKALMQQLLTGKRRVKVDEVAA